MPAGVGFHLAQAKRLRAIAVSQKNDAVAARLLDRILLSGLIPEGYAGYSRPGD